MKEVSAIRHKQFSKRLSMVIILSISMLFCLLTIQNEAVNQTTNTTQNRAKTNQNTNTVVTANSSNANLNNLGITPHDFTGFKPETTSYEVEVPENTKTVEVYAEAQSTKATIKGTGKKELEKGENKIEVVVTAQNGTKKTYTIHVMRGTKKDSTNELKQEGLAELKINDHLKLLPDFQTNQYEYQVQYIGEDTKLDIQTKATNDNYMVEVTGNENLQEGENMITILVSESNGDNVATYQITIHKSLVDEEAMAREEVAKRKQKQKLLIGVVGIVVILVIVFSIVKYRQNRNREERFSRDYFYGGNENDYDEEDEKEEEVPKALREKGNKKQKRKENEEEDNEQEELEKTDKEKIREEFLSHYNQDKDEEKENKTKGKRFK